METTQIIQLIKESRSRTKVRAWFGLLLFLPIYLALVVIAFKGGMYPPFVLLLNPLAWLLLYGIFKCLYDLIFRPAAIYVEGEVIESNKVVNSILKIGSKSLYTYGAFIRYFSIKPTQILALDTNGDLKKQEFSFKPITSLVKSDEAYKQIFADKKISAIINTDGDGVFSFINSYTKKPLKLLTKIPLFLKLLTSALALFFLYFCLRVLIK